MSIQDNKNTTSLVYINQIEVNPSQNTLLKAGQLVTLEPKMMALLQYFINNANEVISRDQLINEVWAGSVVSDNAVNWSISQLRKVLDDKTSNPRFIKTISKKGYQFVAEVTYPTPTQSQIEPSVQPQTTKTKHIKKWILSIAILVLLISAFSLFWDSNPSDSYQLTNHQFITRMPGREEDPKLSPDGKLLLFRHKANTDNAFFQLYLKPLDENRTFPITTNAGEQTGQRVPSSRLVRPFLLSDNEYQYRHAIWSADGYQIYAVRSLVKQPTNCQIVKLSLPVSRDTIASTEVLQSCHQNASSKLALNPKTAELYFTDKRTDAGYRVYSHNLASAQTQQITESAAVGFGVRFIHFSLQNNKLLILQDIGWAQTEFIEYHPDSRSHKTLLSQNAVYYSAYWGPKGDTIWLNWSNERVMAYSPEQKTSTQLVQSANGWNYNTSAANRQMAFYTTSDANSSDLAFYNSVFDDQNTPFSESHPAFAHTTDTVVFVSNESGLPQIWLQQHDQTSKQLSNALKYINFGSLQFSKDDRYLLGLSGINLASIDIQNTTFRIHYTSEQRAFFPSWFEDNKHIVFTRKEQDLWRLYQVAVTEQPEEAKAIDVKSGYIAHVLKNKQIVFNRYEEAGLWSFEPATGLETLLLKDFPKRSYWKVVNQTVYFSARIDGVYGLYKTPLDSYQPVLQKALPSTTSGYFDIKINTQTGIESYVISNHARLESNLKSAQIIYQP